MRTLDQADTEMRAAFAEISAVHGSEILVKFHRMFEAMAHVYMHELATCTAEDLPRKQALLTQSIALAKSLMRDGEMPKV